MKLRLFLDDAACVFIGILIGVLISSVYAGWKL